MVEIPKEQKQLYRAVAELAYAIARVDDDISTDEIEAFHEAIHDNLGQVEGLVNKHFDFVNLNIHPDLEGSYKHAISLIEQEKQFLSRVLVRKFLYVLERVAEVKGISEEERKIIDRFEQDINRIYQDKNNEFSAYRSSEQSNLYSTIGQLAYIMAMADHVMMEEEIAVFKQVIKDNLGNFDWLASDRFKVIQDIVKLDMESTYDHAMFLIKKNIGALDEMMIQKFIDVLTKVAEVAGITPEENALIERFTRDVWSIYKS